MGKLNILYHKSYHVYNRKNVEKVKRDELRAELEEQTKNQSTIAANSEARLSLLRSSKQTIKEKNQKKNERDGERALEKQLKGKTKPIEISTEEDEEQNQDSRFKTNNQNKLKSSSSSIIDPKNGHINFWSGLEHQSDVKNFDCKTLEPNQAYVRDKKREDEKFQDLITMRLDRPAHELQPWYSQGDLKNGVDKKMTERKIKERETKQKLLKHSQDPLTAVKRSLYQSGSFNRIEPNRKRKERQASRSPTPTKKIEESSDDEQDFMPALPPSLLTKPKPSSHDLIRSEPNVKVMKIDEKEEKIKAKKLIESHQQKSKQEDDRNFPNNRFGTYNDMFNPNEIQQIQKNRMKLRNDDHHHHHVAKKRYWEH